MNILNATGAVNEISVTYIANQFHLLLGSDAVITSIVMSGAEFHELVYQCLRAQEREVLEAIKTTEKTLEEIGDVIWSS